MKRTASSWANVNLNSTNKPVCLVACVSKDWDSIHEAGVGWDWEREVVPGVPISHPSGPTDAEEVAQWVLWKGQAKFSMDAKRSRELFSEHEHKVSLSDSQSCGLLVYRLLIKKPEAWNHLLLSCSFSLVRISWGSVSQHIEGIREPWEIPSEILGS